MNLPNIKFYHDNIIENLDYHTAIRFLKTNKACLFLEKGLAITEKPKNNLINQYNTTQEIYGNCKVLNENNETMFCCRDNKIMWYLARNLADIVEYNPPKIKLKFCPKGKGHVGDNFYISSKKNICVVCGNSDYLTRHHIVPYCYRKHIDFYKERDHYDIVVLCLECHRKYETEAEIYKKYFISKYNIKNTNGINQESRGEKYYLKLFNTLRNLNNIIPEKRQKEIIKKLESYYGENFDFQIVEKRAEKIKDEKFSNFTHREVVKNVDNFYEFVLRWRIHFLKVMRPKYMPEYWDITREIKLNKIKEFPSVP